jgi:hydroxypyruvate isomerase
MDLYHCQIVEGDLIQKIKHYLPTGRVAHIQVAGVPSRQELHLGELNYVDIFQVLDELALSCQWQGYVGLEYRPQDGAQQGGTSRGLSWLKTSVNWQD